jgi:thiamine kinase-like enzyme
VVIEGASALLDAEQVLENVDRLPTTLLHGDVHPGNIILRETDGRAVLIDWGNARTGPAGVDLANCIPSRELPAWHGYWSLVEDLSGYPVSAEQRARQFRVGRVCVCVQYLPVSIRLSSEDRCVGMMREALDIGRDLAKN